MSMMCGLELLAEFLRHDLIELRSLQGAGVKDLRNLLGAKDGTAGVDFVEAEEVHCPPENQAP